MNIAKRALAPILAVIVILSLVSCSGGYPVVPEDQLSKVYEESAPSVVEVVVWGASEPSPFSPSREGRGLGTGFVWDSEGHILTNGHVVEPRDDYGDRVFVDRIAVIFSDGSDFDAEVVGIDRISDLAVLKADVPAEKLKPLLLGDSDSVKVGQMVVAIGHPFGYDFTMTSGIVSQIGRTLYSTDSDLPIPGGIIQTDAYINRGSSGGPLMDINGHVIGINEQIYTDGGGTSSGIAFAIPVNTAKHTVPDLIERGSHDYPWVGISYLSLTTSWAAEEAGFEASTRGAMIEDVMSGSPADEAGFLAGDVITAIDGESLNKTLSVVDRVILYEPGDKVVFDVLRDAEPVSIEVTLGKYETGVFRR